MNRLRTINTLAVAAVFTSVPVTLQAASLLEVYQQALQSDPLIHEAESRRLAALEAAPQARGVLFPQLSGGAQWTHSTFEGTNVEGGAGGGVASVAAESTTDASGWQLQLSQSIFRWDQWVNLQQAEKRVAQAEIDYELAQQDLIIRVAARYFDVLGA